MTLLFSYLNLLIIFSPKYKIKPIASEAELGAAMEQQGQREARCRQKANARPDTSWCLWA